VVEKCIGSAVPPGGFGELFAPSKKQRQVGRTGLEPSLPVIAKYPPQAIENKKIKSVSNWL